VADEEVVRVALQAGGVAVAGEEVVRVALQAGGVAVADEEVVRVAHQAGGVAVADEEVDRLAHHPLGADHQPFDVVVGVVLGLLLAEERGESANGSGPIARPRHALRPVSWRPPPDMKYGDDEPAGPRVMKLLRVGAEGEAQVLADPPDADVAASRTTPIRSSWNGTASGVVIVVIGESFVAPPVEGRAPSIIVGLHEGNRPLAAGEMAPGLAPKAAVESQDAETGMVTVYAHLRATRRSLRGA